MKKQLFFDDSLLFGRDNVKRVLGKPEVVGEYNDGISSTDFCTGSVFKLDDGRYRMLYFGHSTEFEGKKLFSAISDDGVNFAPEKLDLGKDYPHEIMQLPNGGEVAFIFEDSHSEGRYKLLMAEFDGARFSVNDVIYVSEDLLHWEKCEGLTWGDGAEPLASVFYNNHRGEYTIMQRPFWGVRTVGCKTTKDWKSFTEYRSALGVDSRDDALSEIYGLYAFEHDGTYFGITHIYEGLHSEYNAKYKNGRISCQLSYSNDGEYWKRGPAEYLVKGDEEYPMRWLAGVVIRDDGIFLYGSASRLEHGDAFHKPGNGNLFVYKLHSDGFVALRSENSDTPARVITREKVWHGGELHLNVNAKDVKVAVYETLVSENLGGNALGIAEPIEGYSAEECIAFSGDSSDFVPRFKSGKTVDDLRGRTLVFEIIFSDGELYSLSGDYTDVFNTEGARYRLFGILPDRK